MKNILFVLLITAIFQSCLKDNTISTQAQFKSDTMSIRTFLNVKNLQAIKVPGGAWYWIDSTGLGAYPVLSDSVEISFSAELIPTLNEVASATELNALLSSTIAGMQLCLTNFPAGSKGSLYIPSGLAFGVSSQTGTDVHSTYKIPSNANLLYKITLVKVWGAHFTGDTTAISTYIGTIIDSLAVDSISVFKDPTGMRYSLDTSKYKGPLAVLSDSIVLTYTATLLNSKTIVAYDSVPTKVALNAQITGWKVLIPKIPQGAKATLFIPSGYGYGSAATATIPTNSNLVYQINLIQVIHHP